MNSLSKLVSCQAMRNKAVIMFYHLKTSLLFYLISAIGFSSLGYSNSIVLPDIGDNGGTVSLAEEYRTGKAVMRNIRRAGGILDDPLIQDYLTELGFRIVAASKTQQPFHFFPINDSSINAFALPGGFIGIHAGLILATQSESELAGVMAHEVAHVTQRHHSRQYEQSSGSIPIVAALIAAMVLGGQNNEIGQAALASAAAGAAQKQINFTRENEKEADRIGIEILINAEFNPHGMPDFFETLDKQSRNYGESIPEFLRTHPVNPSRIADSKHRASRYPNRLSVNPIRYHLLRIRLSVLGSKNKSNLEKKYAALLQQGSYQSKDATQYGYALALQINKKYVQALQQTQILLKKTPEQISYNILKAQIETDAQHYSEAIKTFKTLLALYPRNKMINLSYAETLLKANKIKSANKVLQALIAQATTTPDAYRLLAKTQAKLNKPSQSHQALAEYYYLLGQTHDAIKQLDIALKVPKSSFYLTSRLEARLKEFKDEILQLQSN